GSAASPPVPGVLFEPSSATGTPTCTAVAAVTTATGGFSVGVQARAPAARRRARLVAERVVLESRREGIRDMRAPACREDERAVAVVDLVVDVEEVEGGRSGLDGVAQRVRG